MRCLSWSTQKQMRKMTKINNSRVSIKTKVLLSIDIEVPIKRICDYTTLKSVKNSAIINKIKLVTTTPYMIRLQANNRTLECTNDTLICISDKESKEAELLNIGDSILMSDGTHTIESVEVLCVTKYGSVYSLYTKHDDDTYFANGFAIKHNIVEVEDEEE